MHWFNSEGQKLRDILKKWVQFMRRVLFKRAQITQSLPKGEQFMCMIYQEGQELCNLL